MKIFFIVLGFILVFDFIKVLFGLAFFGRSKKMNCLVCSHEVDSTLIKCDSCGAFLENKPFKQWWFLTYLENRHHRRMTNYVKKNNFWNG
jgi:hypothetical protein